MLLLMAPAVDIAKYCFCQADKKAKKLIKMNFSFANLSFL